MGIMNSAYAALRTKKKMTPTLEDFQDYLATQALSTNTIATYSYAAQQFMQHEPSQEWINKFLRAHNTQPTRAMLRHYLRYIKRHREFDILPLKGRKRKRIRTVLTREEVERLAAGMRDHGMGLLTLFLFETGLRISAALNIHILNIDFVNLKVRGVDKGRKEFEQCITQDLADALATYTEYHEEDELLWTCTRDNVQKIFVKYGQRILSKKVTPHVLRHSIAEHLKKHGMPAEERAVYLNHDLTKLGVTIGTYSPPDREQVHKHWRQIMES